VHAESSATHLLLKQHPPLQVLPEQQGWPGSPQTMHRPLPEVTEQTKPWAQRSDSLLLEQQRVFPCPHGAQVPLLAHTMPSSHKLPQQG
jgi:hypothetical protein